MRTAILAAILACWATPARADFSAVVVSFDWTSAKLATETIDVTVGFTAVAFCVFTGSTSGSVDVVERAGAALPATGGFGCGTSTTDRFGVGYSTHDANAAQLMSVRHTDAGILTFSGNGAAGSDIGVLDVSAIDSDSITFVVDTQATITRRIVLMAWGGSDVTAANTFVFQEPATEVAHGLGATPTGAIFVSGGFATAPPEDTGGGAMAFSLGMCDGTNQWVTSQGGDDAATTSTSRSYANDTEVIALFAEGTTTDGRASCASFDATNINLTWAENAATRYVFALAWVGGQFDVADTTTDTDTGDIDGEPTVGYTPALLFVGGHNQAESVDDTPTNNGELTMGAATGAAARVSHCMLDETGIADTEVSRAQENDAVLCNISTASAIEGLMDVVGMTDPLDLEMDDGDPTENFIGLAIWGAAAVTGRPPSILGGGFLQ